VSTIPNPVSKQTVHQTTLRLRIITNQVEHNVKTRLTKAGKATELFALEQ
jgi:hypothetical protein